MSIVVGWWIVPAAITVAALLWAAWMREPYSDGGSYGFSGLVNLLWYLIALVPSLAAWLIWSLL